MEPNFQILKYLKGNELYKNFKTYLDNDLTVTYKFQHVDTIQKEPEVQSKNWLPSKIKNDKDIFIVEFFFKRFRYINVNVIY